jgi:hypothetical protein
MQDLGPFHAGLQKLLFNASDWISQTIIAFGVHSFSSLFSVYADVPLGRKLLRS